MPRKIKTEVDATTNSTNPEVKFEPSISELVLDFGRHDLNLLVDKLNQVIRKIN